jgi:signal transduction histidine kinase/CheY-like chemotaxis protein
MSSDGAQSRSSANDVLLLASGDPKATRVRTSLAEAGLRVTVCGDMEDLCRRARDGMGIAVISGDALTPASAEYLAQSLSSQAPECDFFAVVLVEGDQRGPNGGHRLASADDAVLLPWPLPSDLLVSAVEFVSRLRRSEQQLKQQKETLQERVIERTAEAERRAEQLRVLATQLTRVEQRERRRLAQTLHDQLQQLLIASLLKLGALRRRVQAEQFRESFQQLEAVLKEALEASRSLTVELSPPILYDAGLAAALEWLGRQTQQKHGLTVDVRADRQAEPLEEELRILLFQAVRELLFNVVKHGKTDRAEVTMTPLEDDRVELVVADAGVGFDPSHLEASQVSDGGFGLFNMRERLESIDGYLALESAPGEGTRARIVAPRRHLPMAAEGAASGAPTSADEGADASPEAEPKIRVLLADDHDMVRQGLASILSDESDIELVGEASDGQEAVHLAVRTQPDVVVMDVAMPRLGGIEATRRILAVLPQVRVIGLSMHEREDMEVAMREAGAVAYLPKGDTTDRLIHTIRGSAFH